MFGKQQLQLVLKKVNCSPVQQYVFKPVSHQLLPVVTELLDSCNWYLPRTGIASPEYEHNRTFVLAGLRLGHNFLKVAQTLGTTLLPCLLPSVPDNSQQLWWPSRALNNQLICVKHGVLLYLLFLLYHSHRLGFLPSFWFLYHVAYCFDMPCLLQIMTFASLNLHQTALTCLTTVIAVNNPTAHANF